jgi:hypothetical protein
MDPCASEILERFVYRPPTEAQRKLLVEAHEKIIACAEFLVYQLPNGRDRAIALSSLEDTRMKMNKAIIFSDVG